MAYIFIRNIIILKLAFVGTFFSILILPRLQQIVSYLLLPARIEGDWEQRGVLA